jgi:hypothetical protein
MIGTNANEETTAARCCQCTGTRVHGSRYCKDCRKQVLTAMRTSGYLAPVPSTTHHRTEIIYLVQTPPSPFSMF